MGSKVLIDSDQCRRTVARIAHDIAEHHPDPSAIALVGLHTRGVPLAERLCRHIEQFAGAAPAIGTASRSTSLTRLPGSRATVVAPGSMPSAARAAAGSPSGLIRSAMG